MTPETPVQTPGTPAEPPTANGTPPRYVERHTLEDVFGAFKNDPMLDAMMENILKQRQRDEEEARDAE